ncbi:MAG: DUF6391 domain-containing protein [bacterium]|nr:DUF6391 domain-containing protein [bacterium]
MIESLAGWLRPVLNIPFISRTRRNHGLEHATIHLLSARVKNLRMAGRSDAGGFILIGDAPTALIETSAREALRRMQNGEQHLAVHPNCGTNLVTTGVLTSAAALLGFSGVSRRDAWERLPFMSMVMIVLLIVSQPLGGSLQKHLTTDGDPGDLTILSVTRSTMPGLMGGTVTVHRVRTADQP